MSAVWTLIPAKSFRDAKQRLASVLSAAERAALSREMLVRTLTAVRAVVGEQPVLVVTTDPEVADFARQSGATEVHHASAAGLNRELRDAAAAVPDDASLLTIHADLPAIDPADIAALLATDADVVIAPDHAGTGTNSLLQRNSPRFFAFGPGSCAKHRLAAEDSGQSVALVKRPGLAADLDDPADWVRWMGHVNPGRC